MASKARRDAAAIALELSGLRPEQCRQRLARQIAPGDAGIALREGAVADADGEQSARQRVIALLPPPLAHMRRDRRGSREHIAQQRPQQDQQHDQEATASAPTKAEVSI